MNGGTESSRPGGRLRGRGPALLGIAVVCGLFGAAEFATRVYVQRHLGPRSLRPPAVFDRWTAFRNNPDYGRNGCQHTVDGFRRDHPVVLEKAPGTIRIFLLGGSVTYGGDTLYPEIDDRFHIADDQTIDHYLEQKLNADLPEHHWEVINAGVKGYLLHQDLALILSTILRYKPDYVILLDGVNDISSLLRAPEPYDPYSETAFHSEFDRLANPGSFASMKLAFTTTLRNDSALFRLMQDSLRERASIQNRRKRASQTTASEDLSPEEQRQYNASYRQLDSYRRVVGEIHSVLAVNGVKHWYLLQPQLALSRKPLAGTEPRLLDYYRKVESRLFVHGLRTLYPEIAQRLKEDAGSRTFGFTDLTSIFDQATGQTFTDYCHLTPEGNRAVAYKIVDLIVDLLHPAPPIRFYTIRPGIGVRHRGIL